MTSPLAAADAPTRAHTSFTLSWGLMSIPVSVFTGTEATRVARSEFIETDAGDVPVGRSPIRKDTGEVIDTAAVVRKAQATNGAWVALSDDEIADATSLVRGQGIIESFIPVKNLARYLSEGQAQVRPKVEKGKLNPAAEKAFALLLKAMKTRKVVALVKVALRGPARYALLNSDGVMTLVLTADAVREHRPMNAVTVTDAEVAMAGALIDAVGVDTPVLLDTNAPLVQAYVDGKAQGLPAPEAKAQPVMVDVMAALEASIDAAKAGKGKVA
jgi:DNA end-binding protein Ku